VICYQVTRARGENVKLMLEDTGLEHEYIRQRRNEDWSGKRAKLVEEGFFSPTLPYIEVGGKRFGKTVPIMRYISVKLGNRYHGSNAEENQFLDYVSDVTNDWFEHMKKGFFGSEVSIECVIYIWWNIF
jgi:glutathione S-transferase